MSRHFFARRIARLAMPVVIAASLLAACASVFVPRQITISAERLQAGLADHFPISRSLGAGLALTVAVPRLTLLPAVNRIALETDVSGGEALLKRPFAGTLALSHRLAFDAADNSVHAIDVRVERLHIEGLASGLEQTIERLARPLAERALEGSVLYALKAGDVERLRAAGVAPGAIRVEATGIVIALVPASP